LVSPGLLQNQPLPVLLFLIMPILVIPLSFNVEPFSFTEGMLTLLDKSTAALVPARSLATTNGYWRSRTAFFRLR
jgi:hypothetical protein